jgi:NAD(P)-dependent dehydrogenase (short-subunit alcohol dehydrogenase family)
MTDQPAAPITLEGRVAIVTGAGHGLGRAHALALARAGAAVVVNDLGVSVTGQAEGTPGDDVVAEIRAAGGEAVAHRGDCADWADAEALVLTAVETFGRLDVLVNNAGIVREGMSFNLTEQDWDAVVRVHLKGHFAPTRFAARHWRERSKAGDEVSGRIVNTTSEAGQFGTTGQLNYVAAKAGITGMTLALARELGRYGVTANAISPRAATRMSGPALGLGDEELARLERGDGFDVQSPANISPLVCYLASEASAHVNGQVFCVRGGSIQLRQGWRTVAEVARDGRWELDLLPAGLDELFADHDPGPEVLEWG